MTLCNRTCWLKAVSVASGLAATTFLLVAILICSWVDITDIQLEGTEIFLPEMPQSSTLPPDDPLSSRLVQNLQPEESSGDADELLVYGRVTTWPGSTVGPVEVQVTLQRSITVGLWKVCMTKSYMKWRRKTERLKYTELHTDSSTPNGTQCWAINPLKYDVLPGDEGIQRVSPLIRIVQDQHFNLPLVTSLGVVVVAVFVTSGGMAKNNAVILAGAALYEFSCLILTVSFMWLFPLVYYAELSDLEQQGFYVHSFGSNIREYGPKAQVQHFFGPALWFGFGSFICMNLAAATAVATYRLTANKASHHRLIRREREAVRKADRQWLVTRL